MGPRVLRSRPGSAWLIGTTALCVVLGIGWGLFAAAFHAFMYVFVLSASINGLCHYHGYKNFDNTATNIRLVAWLTGGEGLHNNHHGYPRSPKFSFRRGEFDPAWPVIKLLTMLRLARPYKTIEQHRTRPHSADSSVCHAVERVGAAPSARRPRRLSPWCSWRHQPQGFELRSCRTRDRG